MSAEPLVQCEVRRGVATITLDSPANRNALSQVLVGDLHAALDRAERPDVRVVVLTHTPPAFCAGADLKERRAGPVDSSPIARAMERLMTSAQPTVAAVKGPVRAGGVGLMAACDLVVVQPDVTFAFTEVRLGLTPAIISVPVLRRAPWSKLAAAFLTGEAFGAGRALEFGLVTHVAGDVDAAVQALCDGILAGGPTAVAVTKGLLRRAGAASLAAELAEMRVLSEQLFESAEGLEGMRALAEQRPPSWLQP